MFNNASHMNFGTANLSIVHGNQKIVHCLQHERQVAGPGEEEWKVKLYQEYDRFPAGRIKILKTFTENGVYREEYEEDPSNLNGKERWDKSRAKWTAHLTCLVQGVKESLPFLSITYTGPDAQKVFKRDCLRYSRNRYGNVVQLRGFNDSDIPMVLFHEELIPVQHIQRHHKYSTLQCYLTLQACIARQNVPKWDPTERISYFCKNVWIQPRNGRISFGPAGPEPDFFHVETFPVWQLESCSNIPVLHPATYSADCITEYLIKYCPDQIFLDVLAFSGTPNSTVYPKIEDCPRHRCQVWDRFSGRPLAKFRSGWTYRVGYSWFAKEDLHPIAMEDGRTRFSINSAAARLQIQEEFLLAFRYEIDIPWHQRRHGWLSQACSIFNTLNIPKDKWSDYDFIDYIELLNLGTLDHDVEDDFDTIAPNIDESDYYLFVHPPPSLPGGFPDIRAWMSGKNFYYYSSDPNGKSAMTESQCLSCRLPPIVPDVMIDGYCWNSDVYNLILAWQEKKGFDPTTMEFARSLGYPIMEVIYSDVDDRHFEDLSEDTDSLPSHTDRVSTGGEAMDIDMPTAFPQLPGIGSPLDRFQPTGDDEMVDDSFMDTAMEVD
ncbi:hypothetical protein E1B28_012009 [Marasmius oreades]|uniref:Uncharacterized protein n=1 Tax=Marasmius oreades TaxID=181124 RepID=A0A9P7RRB8_9AGAR|nr:uncharacterized protein E1B28_012009 [Marasmius oreades]KAG7087968.1 hypothetical protein E1B28_012009 [Marasmius oreades]